MADRGSPACLMIHGLGGGPYELEPLIEAMRVDGRRVLSPTLPGHDAAGPVMPPSTWDQWTRAVEAAHDDASSEAGPPVVVGFSTGALLALHLAASRPVERLVLIAPFFAIRYTDALPFGPVNVVKALARFTPNLRRRSPAVRDAEARGRLAKLDRFRTFNLAAAVSALELIERVTPTLPSIQTPTLILQGSLDTVVEPFRAAWLLDRLGSRRKRLIMLDRSDHLVVYDRDRDRAIAESLDFLRAASTS